MSTPLLSISNLRIDYGTNTAVHGIDLHIDAGECVAIVGESGSGKSSTAAAITGLLPGDARRQGRLRLGDTALERLDEREWRALRGKRIGFVPQDPGLSLDPVKRIDAQLLEALLVHGVPLGQAWTRARQLLEHVGLQDVERVLASYPHQLSGGMCQRVLIAIALANNPPLIVADEPTSALDVSVQRQILDHLESQVREQGRSLLLITHDLGVALDRADRIIVMRHGRIVEQGPTRHLFEQPEQAYTRQLLSASSGQALTRRRQANAAGGPTLLAVSDLGKRWSAGSAAAVEQVSFELPRGTTTSLVGESGSGKSTTARMLLRLESASSGRVSFDGLDVLAADGRQLRDYRRRVQVVYQNPYASLNPRLDLLTLIGEPLRAYRIGNRHSQRRRVEHLLQRVGLPATLLLRRPHQLSGGQRQRVAIARALALEPELLILDEPLSALDASVQAQVLDLLDELQRELGLTYLFISHDLATVRRISDQVLVMHKGRIVEQGSSERVFDAPRSAYTKRLLEDIPGQRIRREVVLDEAVPRYSSAAY
ncbi:dipeptide ABC transporter ATP-binding protein [Pseudomonas sp. LRF_L74]|uniref:dipeptide ABC transporter ATP-binding protein n=1 Tax=Pseudomonas sp. LRF_L74 TaxID=3369422 RepID=UPI003F5E4299